MTRYVIVGNGVASAAAVEKIRENDSEGDITVVSEEPYPAYSRPLITYLLKDEVTEEKMEYKEDDFYEKNNIDLRLGKRAEKVDPENNKITLDENEEIPYDKLLIATGGSPIVPDVSGSDLEGVFTFTKREDVENIQKYMDRENVEDITVIGAGLIGMKTAEALLELGKNVTIVELLDRILASTFDKKASDLIRPVLEEAGCHVITENTVDEIMGNESVQGVKLRSDEELDSDMVVFAIGVAPNVGFVDGSGLEVDDGIVVNENMQTNIQNIYAAGDVAEIPDLISGETHPIAIWPTAHRQGEIAGINMSGGVEKYEGSFAMNSVGICGVPTISAGLTNPQEERFEIIEEYDEESTVYKKVVLEDDKIVGTIFINEIDRAGIYTGLIKSGLDVSSFKDKLLTKEFGILHLPQEYKNRLVSGEGMKI